MDRLGRTATVLIIAAWLTAPDGAAALPASGQRGSEAPRAVQAAPPGIEQELTLKDGTRAIGRVEQVDGERVVFRTISGTVIETSASQISSLRTIEGRRVGGTFYRADPNPTRLFFGPTGRGVPAGGGYVGVYEVVFPFVQVGLTDRISIGGGTPLIFGEGSAHPFWITPKVQVLAGGRTQAALGVMHFLNVGDGNLGIAYGAVTHGSTDSALTVGAGYAYVRSSGEIDGAGVLMLGGEHRVSRRIKVISENYIFTGLGLASVGVRFIGERLSADVGLVVPLGAEERVVFPIVNFVWQF